MRNGISPCGPSIRRSSVVTVMAGSLWDQSAGGSGFWSDERRARVRGHPPARSARFLWWRASAAMTAGFGSRWRREVCRVRSRAGGRGTLAGVTRPVAGPPAYVAAYRIAVVDGRLPFEQAYCLARLVIEHGGGPFVPERAGTMSWRVLKALADEDLVFVTSELSDRLRPAVELTVSALFIEELGGAPPGGVRFDGFRTSRRRRVDRFAEVSERGADLVAAAVHAVAHDHADNGYVVETPSP